MISRLQYITQEDIPNKTHAQLTEQACQGGINWIQLRVKNHTSTWKEDAFETQQICKKYNATFIINDNPQLAKEINADGVHLGKQDMHPTDARALLGDDFIIGGTANNINDIKKLVEAQVSYIGLGPYRFTTTKKKLSPVLSLEDYIEINTYLKSINCNIPIIAIGGIVSDDIPTIFKNNIYGIAIASVISKSKHPTETAQSFVQMIERTPQ